MIILVTDVLVLAKVAFSHSLALQPRFQLVQYLPDITIGQMFKNKTIVEMLISYLLFYKIST